MAQYTFGAGRLFITPQGADSVAYGATEVAALQGVTVDFGFTPKTLHAGPSWSIQGARAKGGVRCKAQWARFTAHAWDALLAGTAGEAGSTRTAVDEPHVISGGAAAVTHAAGYSGDLGVVQAVTGEPYRRVAAAPAGRQYVADDAGGYTFDAAQDGQAVLISYTHEAATGRRIMLRGQAPGHTPRFSAVLTGTFNGQSHTLTLPECVAGGIGWRAGLDGWTLPEFPFEAVADQSGLVGTWNFEALRDYALPLIYTSWTYPIDASENIESLALVTGGMLQDFVLYPEEASVVAELVSGSLTSELIEIAAYTEAAKAEALFVDGSLVVALIELPNRPHEIDVLIVIDSGTLETVVVGIDESDAEIGVSISIANGELT